MRSSPSGMSTAFLLSSLLLGTPTRPSRRARRITPSSAYFRWSPTGAVGCGILGKAGAIQRLVSACFPGSGSHYCPWHLQFRVTQRSRNSLRAKQYVAWPNMAPSSPVTRSSSGWCPRSFPIILSLPTSSILCGGRHLVGCLWGPPAFLRDACGHPGVNNLLTGFARLANGIATIVPGVPPPKERVAQQTTILMRARGADPAPRTGRRWMQLHFCKPCTLLPSRHGNRPLRYRKTNGKQSRHRSGVILAALIPPRAAMLRARRGLSRKQNAFTHNPFLPMKLRQTHLPALFPQRSLPVYAIMGSPSFTCLYSSSNFRSFCPSGIFCI